MSYVRKLMLVSLLLLAACSTTTATITYCRDAPEASVIKVED